MASPKSDVAILEDNGQLQKLAKLLHNNEEKLMGNITSEVEREKYLKQCNEAYDKVNSLLDEANKMQEMFEQESDQIKTDIANDILKYVKYGINMGMQNIRNLSLRVTCVDKIKTHYGSLVEELKTLDTDNITNVRRLTKDVTQYKELMWEYTNKCRSASARATSKTFSMFLKQEGIKFEHLVEKHKNELGFEGEFETLEDAQKLEVYNSIIKESGRAEIPKLELASGAVGVAVLVVTACMMVWDIFTAEHKLEAVLSHSLEALSEVGAFTVQVMTEAAVTTAVADAELGVFAVALAGFVAGTVAGLVFVAISGLLIEAIFGSGGKAAPAIDGLKFHTAKMPDGMAFALQISHDG